MTWNDGVADAFEQGPDAFGRRTPSGTNPLITREQDKNDQSPPVAAGTDVARPKARVALVGVTNAVGAVNVARHAVKPNGELKQLERFRAPTADEYNSIMFGGKIVQGGTVATNVPTGTNAENAMQRTPLGAVIESKWKKWVLFAGLGVAAAGFGYVFLKKRADDVEDDFDDEE